MYVHLPNNTAKLSVHSYLQVLEMVFIVCLYAYYFTEGDSSFLLDGLDRFSHHLYNMESLYRAVSITILVIIPLATSLRIAAFSWFWFRKSKISFYTVTYQPMYSFVCLIHKRLEHVIITVKRLKSIFSCITDTYLYSGLDTRRNCCFMLHILYFTTGIFFYLSFYKIQIL